MAIIDLIALALLVVIGVLVVQNRRSAAADRPTPRTADPEALRLAEEVRELRARIQVLERVITDNHGSTDLANEIDRLRDR